MNRKMPGEYGEQSWRMFWWRLPLVWRDYWRLKQYKKPFLGLRWFFWMIW
jgi:hypothetical protein